MFFIKEVSQTDSAELIAGHEMLSYYYLNGDQLQGCSPKVNKIVQLKIILNYVFYPLPQTD